MRSSQGTTGSRPLRLSTYSSLANTHDQWWQWLRARRSRFRWPTWNMSKTPLV